MLDEVGAVQLAAVASNVTLSLPLSGTVASPVTVLLGGVPEFTSAVAVAVALRLTVPDVISSTVGVCTSVQVVLAPMASVVPTHERGFGFAAVEVTARLFRAMLPLLCTVTVQDTAVGTTHRHRSAPVAKNTVNSL